MDELNLSEDMKETMRRIAAANKAQQRQSKTMLAGFKAMDERDIDYMDESMDPLYDFAHAGSDTEEMIREYIDHIATFDRQEAEHRLNSLEDILGYKSDIVYAAGILAKRLHSGQKDKGGKDYFESHLLPVAKDGFEWKEKTIGFLHDAVEDTDVTVEEVMQRLDSILEEINSRDKDEWWEDWMEGITPFSSATQHIMTDAERTEIAEALTLLNRNNSSGREEYIDKIMGNWLAMKVKLHDLKSNLDLTRIENPEGKDFERARRYKDEYETLFSKLSHISLM